MGGGIHVLTDESPVALGGEISKIMQSAESVEISSYARPVRGRKPEELRAPESRVRVLVDARKLGGGGIGVYIENLLTGLQGLGSADVTAIVHDPSHLEGRGLSGVTPLVDKARLYSADEMLNLTKRVDFTAFDVFHSPHYTLPFGIKIPTVVTVHDLIHITHPERFYYPLIARRLISSAVKRATRVVAVSHATANQLTRMLPGSAEKVMVVPNALDPFFLIEAPWIEYEDRFLNPYLVATLSNLKPHKGLADLLETFRALKGSTDPVLAKIAPALRLVLVGIGTESLRGSQDLPNGVSVAGKVSLTELQSLYAGALALIVASKAEGFCLPAIEAQACRTPVIARPIPAVLELMTTNDFVCRDMSREALRGGIEEFLRARLIATEENDSGVPLGHMRRFCREDVARAVLGVYRLAVSDFGSR